MTKRLYPGESRGADEVAILEKEGGRAPVRFLAIDGSEISGSRFELLPGSHHIEVYLRMQQSFNSGTVESRAWARVPCAAVFEAIAGATYFIRGDVERLGDAAFATSVRPRVWIADRSAPQVQLAEYRCRFE